MPQKLEVRLIDLHGRLRSRQDSNLLKLLKATPGVLQMTAQGHEDRPREVTVTHSELSEVLICHEHRADVIPIEQPVTCPGRKETVKVLRRSAVTPSRS